MVLGLAFSFSGLGVGCRVMGLRLYGLGSLYISSIPLLLGSLHLTITVAANGNLGYNGPLFQGQVL